MRRKSYETQQRLQPLPQARIQASEEGISPTNLPPWSRISQDPKRSSLQITPLYNAYRKATKKNTQQHNHFWAFWESFTQHEHIYMTGFRAGKDSKVYSLISLASVVWYMSQVTCFIPPISAVCHHRILWMFAKFSAEHPYPLCRLAVGMYQLWNTFLEIRFLGCS